LQHLWVTYLELRAAPAPAPLHSGSERIELEALSGAAYRALYQRVGEPLRWDTRLKMPPAELEALLAGGALRTYVVREARGDPVGFCEFDVSAFPELELKHFGLVREAQGRGLGPWLLSTALNREWESGASPLISRKGSASGR
jgi:GNAT superfamily N-acetyltransferase